MINLGYSRFEGRRCLTFRYLPEIRWCDTKHHEGDRYWKHIYICIKIMNLIETIKWQNQRLAKTTVPTSALFGIAMPSWIWALATLRAMRMTMAVMPWRDVFNGTAPYAKTEMSSCWCYFYHWLQGTLSKNNFRRENQWRKFLEKFPCIKIPQGCQIV